MCQCGVAGHIPELSQSDGTVKQEKDRLEEKFKENGEETVRLALKCVGKALIVDFNCKETDWTCWVPIAGNETWRYMCINSWGVFRKTSCSSTPGTP